MLRDGASYLLLKKFIELTYCAEPCETLVVDKCLYRVDANNHHVYSQIKLYAIHKEWLVKVPLNNQLLLHIVVGQIFELVEQTNVFPLSAYLWLCDVGSVWVCLHISFKSYAFLSVGQSESLGNEVESLWMQQIGELHHRSKHILVSEHVAIRIPVYHWHLLHGGVHQHI